MKIRRIEITGYRGVEYVDAKIHEGGVVVKGECESGKTSFLDAIRAALVASGVAPEDIRHGHDRAEILVEADTEKSKIHVRRRITQNGNSVNVTNEDGFKLDSPQRRLLDMLGGGGFDPLDFFTAKEDRQRKILLAAMPCQVTADDLKRWDVPVGPGLPSLDGHGFEVLQRLRQRFYDQRTDANREAKGHAADAARLEEAAEKLSADQDDDLIKTAEALQAAVERTGAAVSDLQARKRAADKAREATGETRRKIEGLRAEAQVTRDRAAAQGAPSADTMTDAEAQVERTRAEVLRLRALLKQAEAHVTDAEQRLMTLQQQARIFNASISEAEGLSQRADELEATIASAAPEVTPEEEASTRDAYVYAMDRYAALGRARTECAARVEATEARQLADFSQANADNLDRLVKRLTDVAPGELAARGNAIEGFDFETMSLDGTPISSLCGAEKMEFAVKLAKRANPKAKILICDGLERLDPARMEAFVKLATEDGWQLIASRVDAGQIRFDHIEA